MLRLFSVFSVSLLLSVTNVFAQEREENLAQAASDPTAPLTAYLFQNFYTGSYHGQGGVDGNRVQLRAAVPYKLGTTDNIFRLTLPYITDSPSGSSGVSDITVFNLTTFNANWGRYGLGAVALLPTGEEGLSTERWAIGPAAGFIAQSGWGIWGLFNQNLIDVAGDSDRDTVNLSVVQPIVSASLGNDWSIGTSDMSVTYDWNENEFISLPLGIQLNKLVRFGTTPVQFGLSYEYNFYDEGVTPEETIGLTIKVLVP